MPAVARHREWAPPVGWSVRQIDRGRTETAAQRAVMPGAASDRSRGLPVVLPLRRNNDTMLTRFHTESWNRINMVGRPLASATVEERGPGVAAH